MQRYLKSGWTSLDFKWCEFQMIKKGTLLHRNWSWSTTIFDCFLPSFIISLHDPLDGAYPISWPMDLYHNGPVPVKGGSCKLNYITGCLSYCCRIYLTSSVPSEGPICSDSSGPFRSEEMIAAACFREIPLNQLHWRINVMHAWRM